LAARSAVSSVSFWCTAVVSISGGRPPEHILLPRTKRNAQDGEPPGTLRLRHARCRSLPFGRLTGACVPRSGDGQHARLGPDRGGRGGGPRAQDVLVPRAGPVPAPEARCGAG